MRAGEPGGAWRVVVVDDQALVVSAFEMLLAAQADLEVAGSAADMIEIGRASCRERV